MKTTPWFPAHVKPVRKGVYEWRLPSNPDIRWFRRWTGYGWMWGNPHPTVAQHSSSFAHITRGEKWRGLASKDGK